MNEEPLEKEIREALGDTERCGFRTTQAEAAEMARRNLVRIEWLQTARQISHLSDTESS